MSDILISWGGFSALILSLVIILSLFARYKLSSGVFLCSPLTFIELVLLYYVIVGPMIMICNGDVSYAGKDMRDYVSLSWCGAALSYASIRLGYLVKLEINVLSIPSLSSSVIKRWGILFFCAGILFYSFFGGISISHLLNASETNPFSNSESSLSGYFKQAINLCVPGCCLLLLHYLKKHSTNAKFCLIICTVLSLLFFAIAGFRYRIIYLLISMFTIYYSVKKLKPSVMKWLLIFVSLIFVMGVIGAGRNYHRGLDIQRVADNSYADLLQKGMNDTRIFYATGALMDNVIKNHNYTYFKPISTAVLMPIPRKIFPEKPDASYLVQMNKNIWGTADYGIAFMNYGEAFYSFGYYGIVMYGILFGIISRIPDSYARKNSDSPFVILALALYNGFIYVAISRGYIAQQMTIFALTVLLPLFILKKVKSN